MSCNYYKQKQTLISAIIAIILLLNKHLFHYSIRRFLKVMCSPLKGEKNNIFTLKINFNGARKMKARTRETQTLRKVMFALFPINLMNFQHAVQCSSGTRQPTIQSVSARIKRQLQVENFSVKKTQRNFKFGPKKKKFFEREGEKEETQTHAHIPNTKQCELVKVVKTDETLKCSSSSS